MNNKVKTNFKQAAQPKLRFPRFRDDEDWEVELLGDVCEILNNRRQPISSNNRAKGEYPYYGASGIVDYVDNYIFDERLVLVGEDGAKWGAFENTAFIAEGKYWVNNHAHVLRPIKIKDVLLENYLVMQDIGPYITGAAPPKLTLGKLKEISIPFPQSNAEQQEIADCLTSIDDLITAQSQKLGALKNHKKGLMQQLFPAHGETVPKLRFPEFQNTPGWEIKSLGDICDVRDGTHDSPAFYNVGKPLVTSKNLLSSGLLDLVNVSYISENDYEKINKRSRVDIGDILFGMIGTIGNPVMVKSDGFAIKNVALIKQKNDLINSYLVHFLNSQYISVLFNTLNTGNSQKFIALGQIRNLSIPVPAVVEQQRIAECFTSIDNIIAAQTHKLDALKNQKNGLMQKLFPNVSDISE